MAVKSKGGNAGLKRETAPNINKSGDGGSGVASSITGTSVTRAGGGGGYSGGGGGSWNGDWGSSNGGGGSSYIGGLIISPIHTYFATVTAATITMTAVS